LTGTCRLILTSAFLMLMVPMTMAATPPELVSYQGVLRSSAGAPLDGTYDMVFRFTDTPAGGTLLLTDYHTGPDAIVIDGGLFTALLGGGTLSPGIESSLQGVFSNYSAVYVEVQVGAETLAPRVQVVSTAFALNAGQFGGRLPDDYIDTGGGAQIKTGSLTSMTSLVADSGATTGNVRAVNATTLSTSGVGVLGSALASSGLTEGVRGQSTSPDGRGVVGGAFAASGATTGVYGESHSPDGTGVIGIATAASGGTVGVGGENFSTLGTGVAGVARATSGDAWGVYGETSSSTGYGVVSIGDSITAGDIYATGTKFFLTEHPKRADSAIRFACLEGGEIGVYQRGSGRLDRGEAYIEFPDPFPLVAAGKITVQVTAEEESGALYVPRNGISAEGFTVRESGGAGSNTPFNYLVMAERSGYEDAKAVRSISLSDKIVTTPRLSAAEKSILRATIPQGSVEGIKPEQRSELYSALHDGDFDASCRLLGGCGAEARETPKNSATRETPNSASKHDVRHVTSTDPPREAEALPAAASTPPVPPSSLMAPHTVSETVDPGDVVVVDRLSSGALRPGSYAYDRGVVGVVASVVGRKLPGETALVAIAGIVPARVDADYGGIAVGDLLVVSPTPGHAMRAYDPMPGTIVGKALEPLKTGQATIRILLTPR